MTTYTEPQRPLEFVLYEEDMLSRESLTIPSGTAAFDAGMVLGRTLASGSATAVAFGTNTANAGAMGTITVGAAAKIGTYTLVVVEPASGAGTFVVTDPEGLVIGRGAVASAFEQGGLAFTLADATDYVAGDGFHIHVTGTAKYIPYDDALTTGANVARAIALYDCDASGSSDVAVAGLVRLATVKTAALQWHADADATAKAKAYADLAKVTILARS